MRYDIFVIYSYVIHSGHATGAQRHSSDVCVLLVWTRAYGFVVLVEGLKDKPSAY